MATVRYETSVQLPVGVDVAWRVCAEMGRWHEWGDALAVRLAPGENGRWRPSFAFSLQPRVPGVPLFPELQVRIVEHEPARTLVWEGRSLGIRGRHGFRFTPLTDRTSALVHWEQLDDPTHLVAPSGVLGRMERTHRRFNLELKNHLLATETPRFVLRTVEAGGCSFATVDQGAGEPVVLLHGYPQSHLAWRHVIEDLSRDHRVVAPDLPGWGRSSRSTDVSYRFDDEVERLVAFLRNVSDGPVSLVAHDYGGYLALGLAQRHPTLLRRLALLNTRGHGTFRPRWRAFFRTVQLGLQHLPSVRALDWGRIHGGGFSRETERGAFREDIRRVYLEPLSTPEGRAWFTHFFRHGYELRPRPELRDALRALAVPKLVIWGEQDAYLATRIGDELAQASGRPLHRLRGIGHYVMEEAPDDVTRVLRDFLAEPRGA